MLPVRDLPRHFTPVPVPRFGRRPVLPSEVREIFLGLDGLGGIHQGGAKVLHLDVACGDVWRCVE